MCATHAKRKKPETKVTFCIIPLKLKVKDWQIYGDIE